MIKSCPIRLNSTHLIQFISTKSIPPHQHYHYHQHYHQHHHQHQYPTSHNFAQTCQEKLVNQSSTSKPTQQSNPILQSTSTSTSIINYHQELTLNSITETLISYLNQNNYSAFKELYSKHFNTTFNLNNGHKTLLSISKIFKSLSRLGQGMGLMRRIMKSLHILNYPNGSQFIIQEYIGILIKWGRFDRALNYLNMFDFNSIDHQVLNLLNHSSYTSQFPNLRKTKLPKNLFKVNQVIWEKVLMIYLMMNRIDLVLKIEEEFKSKGLEWSDECLNQFLVARIIQIKHSTRLDPNQKIKTLNQLIHELKDRHSSIGFHQSQSLLRLEYDILGIDELLKLVQVQETDRDLITIRNILRAWLDALIDPNRDNPSSNPNQVGNVLIKLNDLYQSNQDCNLIDESELEKYTRYMREWLERKINARIYNSFQDDGNQSDEAYDSSKSKSILTIDRDHPELGYHQLESLLNSVYNSSNLHQDERLEKKPSSRMISELSRIESMIGSSSQSIRQLIRESIIDRELNIRSSHLIGLIWTKLIEVDLIGLLNLLEREIKFGYRLVLTGLLISLVLGGLVAIRVPKSILLLFSQRLIDQQDINSSSFRIKDQEEDHGPRPYLRAARAAASVGNFFLVKELHLDLINRFGHDVYWNESCGMDYLTMVVESLMKLNEPIEAHEEILKVFKQTSLLESWIKEEDLMELQGDREDGLMGGLDLNQHQYFVNEEIREYFREKEEISKLISKINFNFYKRKLKKKESLLKSLFRIKKKLEFKIHKMESLIQNYSASLNPKSKNDVLMVVDEEMGSHLGELKNDFDFEKGLMEVRKRLKEFKVAESLNEEVIKIWSKKSSRTK